MIVRLKVLQSQGCLLRAYTFQFYDSPIKRVPTDFIAIKTKEVSIL